jgi:hypothetical protein
MNTGLTDDGIKTLAKGDWPNLKFINLLQNNLTG